MDSQETTDTSPSLTYSEEKKSSPLKKVILIIFFVLILGGIPVATFLVQKQQIFKSKAGSDIRGIFTLPGYVQAEPGDSTGLKFLTSQTDITIWLNSAVQLPDDQFTPTPTPPSGGGGAVVNLKPTATPAAATATPASAVPLGATSTPIPTATSVPATPTPTMAPAGPPQSPIALWGGCVKEGSVVKVTLNWDASMEGSRPNYYNLVGVLPPPNYSSTSFSFTGEPGKSYNWTVAACSTTGGCSAAAVGNNVTCPTL